MRRRCLYAVFAILFFGCGSVHKPDSRDAGDDQLLLPLWEITSPSGKTSHLFGTCHFGVTLDETLTDAHRPLLVNAKLVVIEADVSQIEPMSLITQMTLEKGQSLRALLGEEAWKQLITTLKPGLPPLALDRMHPWLVSTVLVAKAAGQGAQEGKPANSMDADILSRAKSRGQAVDFLETIDDFLSIVRQFPLRESAEEIQKQLADPEAQPARLDEILDICRGRPMADSEFDAALARSRSLDLTFRERNARWMPRLEKILEHDGGFVAVGAGHMLGNQGLLKRLEEKGFRTRRLTIPRGEAPKLAPVEANQVMPPSTPTPTAAAPAVGPGTALVQAEFRATILAKLRERLVRAFCLPTAPFITCTGISESGCTNLSARAFDACVEQYEEEIQNAVATKQSNGLPRALGSCMGASFEFEIRFDGELTLDEACFKKVTSAPKAH